MSINHSFKAHVLALIIAALGGCQSNSEDTPRTQAADAQEVQELLLEQLRQQVDQTDPGLSVDSSAVRVTMYTSTVVPGLRYYFAAYRPEEISHRYYAAVAGSRDGTPQLIRAEADWATVTRGWSPSTAATAIKACEELYVTTKTRSPAEVSFITKDATTFPSLLPTEVGQVRDRVELPRATQIGQNTWQVVFWVVQPRTPRGAVKYRCLIPAAQQGGSVVLAAMDSVVFPEIP